MSPFIYPALIGDIFDQLVIEDMIEGRLSNIA